MRHNLVLGFIVCLCLIFIVSLPVVCAAETPRNLLENGGFEEFDASHRIIAWHKDSWNANSFIAITPQRAHSGKYAAALQAIEKNDIRLVQAVAVEPNTVYQLIGWIATRGVNRGEAGANLSVLGGTVLQEGLTGDNDWTSFKFTFRTNPNQTRIVVGVRLGFYGQTATGTAYFDDIRLEKVFDPSVTYQQLSPAQQPPDIDQMERPQIDSPQVRQENILNTFKKWVPIIIFGLYYFLVFLGIRFREHIRNFCCKPGIKSQLHNVLMVGIMVAFFIKFFYIIIMENWVFPYGNSVRVDYPQLKILGLILDSAAAWLLYVLFNSKSRWRAFIIAITLVFLPAMTMNSVNGIENSLICFLISLTFYLIVKRKHSWALLSSAALLFINSQSFFIGLPLIYYLGFRRNKQVKYGNIVQGIIIPALILGILKTLFLSGAFPNKAANLSLFFNWKDINIGSILNHAIIFNQGKLLFVLSMGCFMYFMNKRRNLSFLALTCAWVGFAFFIFWPNGMDGALLPILTVLLIAFGFNQDLKVLYGITILGISSLFNIYTFAMSPNSSDRIMYILAIVNCVLFGILTGMLFIKATSQGRKWGSLCQVYSEYLQTGLRVKLKTVPFSMRKRDFFYLGILTLIYACFLFNQLGTRMTPQKGLDFNKADQGIEISFEKPAVLHTLAYYDAEGVGNLEIQTFRNSQWEKLGDFSSEDYYVLKRKPLPHLKVARIRIVPAPSAGHINEIAFFDASNRLIRVRDVKEISNNRTIPSKDHPLFDEQSRMLVKPSFLNSTYFDEIYHGRTAYEFVKGMPVYENTHPPLGKDILALGIIIFGMNPFGMRFMHAVAGLLLIITLFFLGRMVLGTRFGAYGLMLLGMLDFMPFVMSRYSTIDSTSVLFITLMFLFAFRFIRQQTRSEKFFRILATLILMIFFFTLAAATKWTAIYGSAGVFIIFIIATFKRESTKLTEPLTGKLPEADPKNQFLKSFWTSYSWKKLVICALILFLLIAPLLYFLTYIPYLHASGVKNAFTLAGIREVLANQRGMYQYHSQLNATHPFASAWWSWPFNFKPLWLYMDENPPIGQKGTIVCLGNPFIWFLSLVSMVILFYQFISRRRLFVLFYIFICFTAQYLPWVLISRISFIYHFYPVLPWFFICAVIVLEPFWAIGRGKYRWVVYLAAGAALALLILFHPALTGYDVSQKYIDFLHFYPRDWFF